MDPLTEYVVRNYRIVQEVGGDGYCRYFRAEAGSGSGQVTVGVLRPLPLDPAFPGRFQVQLDRACALSHPGLLPILHFSREAQGYYVVMGQCPGPSLAARVAEQPLELSDALGIVANCAAVLDYLHRSGVVHGSLHPNAIFCALAQPQLVSPGLARAVDPIGLAAGNSTPEYLSPEQIQGKPADSRSDLYTLGLILYHLLTGEHPQPGVPPSFATGMPQVDRVLEQLVQVSPRLRPRRAGQVRAALSGLHTDQPAADSASVSVEPVATVAVVGPTGSHGPRSLPSRGNQANAVGLGIAAFQAGDFAEAVRLLKLAARSAPRSVRVLGYLGCALYQTGRYREAAAVFAKAVSMRPESSRLRYNLGNALLACGDRQGAMAHFHAAWESDPRCTAAVLALTHLERLPAGGASN